MPKRNIVFQVALFFLLSLCATTVFSQNYQQIGFVNSTDVLNVMPERIEASNVLNDLNTKYKDELKIMQNDYNKKYSDFISYQTSMAESIRLRRMQELYELERQINEFMKVADADIQNKEQNLLEPLRSKLKEAIYQVGVERKLVCIYDLADPALAFVTPDATDITPFVKQKLGIK